MIKARLSNGIFVLGITADNLRLLKEGKPLVCDLSELGGTDFVSVIYGDTIQAATKELERLTGCTAPMH